MNHVLNCLALIAALVISVPILVLFAECLASVFPRRDNDPISPRPTLAMLVPAHDEELVIAATLRSLRAAMLPGDQLIVVADNCTDGTAAIARVEGATVIERKDTERRGKGFALRFGMDAMKQNPPEAVIIFDADIAVDAETVDRLARATARCGLPVQARYVLSAPTSAGVRGVVSSLAFIMKNVVRPAGLHNLGLPCPLFGTGMAFPYQMLANANFSGGHLVEDMQLGIELLAGGYPTIYCEKARIEGTLPDRAKSALDQRTRWEHGHLSVIRSACLPLAIAGIRKGRVQMVAAAFDLSVPPLALLSLAWLGVTAVCITVCIAGKFVGTGLLPLEVCGTSGALLASSVLIAWCRSCRHLPLQSLAAVPLYVLWKIPLYFRGIFNPQKSWVRTDRTITGGTSNV